MSALVLKDSYILLVNLLVQRQVKYLLHFGIPTRI